MLGRLGASIRKAFGLDNLVSNLLFLAITAAVGIAVRAIAKVPLPYLIPSGVVVFLLLVAGWLQLTKWHLRRVKPIASPPPAHTTRRMTGDEAKEILLRNYWGEESYKASSEWNSEEQRAYLNLKCKEAGLGSLRVTVTDATGANATHEFHTDIRAGADVTDWFPDHFREAPTPLLKGDYGVKWEVLISGGTWAEAAASTFRIPHSDTPERPADVEVVYPSGRRDALAMPETVHPGANVSLKDHPPDDPGSEDNSKRVIVDVTPEELNNFYDKYMDIQAEQLVKPYLGKWMKVSGPLYNVYPWNGRNFQVRFDPETYTYVYLVFTDRSWLERILAIPRGTQIEVLGRIDKVGTVTLTLMHCELLAP